MNHFKNILVLLIAICMVCPAAFAQDAPPKPRVKVPAEKSKSSRKKRSSKKSESNKNDSEDQEPESKKKPKKSKSDMKSDDQDKDKSDSDDKEKKQEEDKKESEEKKKSDDDKDSDDEKKKADEKKTKKKSANRRNRFFSTTNRDNERVSNYSKQSEGFVEIFKPIAASISESTIAVVSGKKQIALGTIVDADGLILTKASELRGSLGCRLHDGTIVDATVFGIDPETDLAMLKIDAENLSAAQWSDEPPPITGRWLVTPQTGDDGKSELPTIGIVSVDTRVIPPSKAFIGINMRNLETGGVRVTLVVSRSPADLSDLWVNDVIKSVDGRDVADAEDIREVLEQLSANDRITLGVERGDEKKEIRLTLAEKDKVSPEHARSNLQNSMGSILSRRRKNFPLAFQHDSMLSSNTCGGPIADLSGKVVGINIARAGRVASLALPVEIVREKVKLLKTGKFTPAIVNKEAIQRISVELEEMDEKFSDLPDKKSVLGRKYAIESAKMEEINKTLVELRKRLKVIEEKSKTYKTEYDSVKKELDNIRKSRQRLEADRDLLQNGSR